MKDASESVHTKKFYRSETDNINECAVVAVEDILFPH